MKQDRINYFACEFFLSHSTKVHYMLPSLCPSLAPLGSSSLYRGVSLIFSVFSEGLVGYSKKNVKRIGARMLEVKC